MTAPPGTVRASVAVGDAELRLTLKVQIRTVTKFRLKDWRSRVRISGAGITATTEVGCGDRFEVRNEIWEAVESMIGLVRVSERQGRRPDADRVRFEASAFVTITGIA